MSQKTERKGDAGSESEKQKFEPDENIVHRDNFEVYDNCSIKLVRNDTNEDDVRKIYVIQMLQDKEDRDSYYVYSRWGLENSVGQQRMSKPSSYNDAYKLFCRRFTDKTEISWDDHENPRKYRGRYSVYVRERPPGRRKTRGKRPGSKPVYIYSAGYEPSKEEEEEERKRQEEEEGEEEEPEVVEEPPSAQKATEEPVSPEKAFRLQNIYQTIEILKELCYEINVLRDIKDIKTSDKIVKELSNRIFYMMPGAFGSPKPSLIDTNEKIRAAVSVLGDSVKSEKPEE